MLRIYSVFVASVLLAATLADGDWMVDGDIKLKWYATLMLSGVLGMCFAWRRPHMGLWSTLLTWAVAFVAFIQVGYGILQFAGMLPGHRGFRAVGNFDNPAGYATMLACCVPFVLRLAFAMRGWRRWVVWSVYGLVAVALVLSGSRAGLLSAMVVTVLFFARHWRSVWYGLPVWTKGLGVFLIVVLLCGMYAVKKDSADGRVIIWRCTAEMIADRPLFGHGYGSFEAEYMLYQARYFERHPESRFILLADNVKHPFNEFLLVLAEFGVFGLLLVVWLWVWTRRTYRRHRTNRAFTGLLVFVALSVLSLFSYPFKYPFAWLSVAMGVVMLCGPDCGVRKRAFRLYSSALIVLFSVFVLGYTARQAWYECRWKRLVDKSMLGKTREVMPGYEAITPHLRSNGYFLYNYAAELNGLGRFDESAKVLELCVTRLNDYDVQQLWADNLYQKKEYAEAERRSWLAYHMCPNRFMPLYELFKSAEVQGDTLRMVDLAEMILEKPVKIPSMEINHIKQEMKVFLDAGKFLGGKIANPNGSFVLSRIEQEKELL